MTMKLNPKVLGRLPQELKILIKGSEVPVFCQELHPDPISHDHLLMKQGGTIYNGSHLDSKRFTPEEEAIIKSKRMFYVPLR